MRCRKWQVRTILLMGHADLKFDTDMRGFTHEAA